MRTDHKVKGLKRLAVEFASKNMLDKAAREFPGESAMTGVARLLPELGQHMREGMEQAKAAVALLKSASDFDPEIHGRISTRTSAIPTETRPNHGLSSSPRPRPLPQSCGGSTRSGSASAFTLWRSTSRPGSRRTGRTGSRTVCRSPWRKNRE